MPTSFSVPMNTKNYYWRYEPYPEVEFETSPDGRRACCSWGNVLVKIEPHRLGILFNYKESSYAAVALFAPRH